MTNDALSNRTLFFLFAFCAIAIISLVVMALFFPNPRPPSEPFGGIFSVPDPSEFGAEIQRLYTTDRTEQAVILHRIHARTRLFTSEDAASLVQWVRSGFYDPASHEARLRMAAMIGKAVMAPALIDGIEQAVRDGDERAVTNLTNILAGADRRYREIFGDRPTVENLENAREYLATKEGQDRSR